jgi:PAS domain S-box-containing protein
VRQRLSLLAMAALIPLIALAAGLTFFSLRQQMSALRTSAMEHARDNLTIVERYLSTQADVLRSLASAPQLDGPEPDLAAFHTLVSRFRNELGYWDVVILSDMAGRQIVNTRLPFGRPLPTIVDEESYRRVIETREPVVGNLSGPGAFTTDATPRVSIRVPVLRDGQVRYVMTAVISPAHLAELLVHNTDPQWRSFLVDGSGRIAASARHPEAVGKRPSERTLAARAAGREGNYEGVTLDGEQTFTAFQTSDRIGWSSHVSILQEFYNAPLVRSVWILGATVTVALLITFGFIWLLRQEAQRRERTAALLGATLDNMDQGLVMVDGAGILQVCNRRAVEMLDLPPEFQYSKPSFAEFVAHRASTSELAGSAESRIPWQKLKADLLGAPPVHECTRPTGTALEIRTVHLPDGGAVRTFTDVTARKRAEADLRASEARYRFLTENATDMMVRTDLAGRRRYLSPACREILGYEPDELIGTRLVDDVHPDDLAAAASGLDALTSGRADHETISYRVPHKAGHWVWLEARRRLVRDADGNPLEVISVVRDITERVQLEERLRQSQKMEAVGQLTGGVAHDFNNLLTVILGNAELLTENPGDPAQTSALARQILETAERGAELNQKLLAFGRRQSLKPERLRIDQIVDDMLPLLHRALGEHIALKVELGSGQHRALSDRTLLESAILNLVVNARDAMPQGGTLTITTGERSAGPGEGPLPIGQEVVFVTIADTGTGMSPEVMARAFEPFFTTKDVGKGTGLGLSMVYGFAQQTGGHVSIRSREGEGTAVTILLPSAGGGFIEVAEDTREPVPSPGRERILVVEDEPQVLQFVSSQLVSLGYAVTAVSTARDALDLIEQGRCFDLLFTDVVLPQGMSGVELARQAKSLCPELKVLLTSGYSEETFEHHGRPDPSTLLLRKPYRRRELAETLRAVLD